MAGDGERRMLFDIRGRRKKNAVRVVYAVLALLMGGSLFLTVGPFSISELFNAGSASSASEVFDDQVERIEGRLARDPTNEALLLSLTRAQISAGNAKAGAEEIATTQPIAIDARDAYARALQAWNRYLKQAGDEPNPVAAQLVAATSMKLAERGSYSVPETESNIAVAVAAQRIAAEQRPNVGSLSQLAIYEFANRNFKAGDKAAKQAAASVPSKTEAKNIEKQLAEFRKRGKLFAKSLARGRKAEERSGGGEPLQNPLGGFGSSTPGQ